MGPATLPLSLTLGRLLSPGLIVPLIVLEFPSSARLWAMGIFIAAALSDWADGALARRWNQASAWGQILDPIADKVLCLLTLVALVADGAGLDGAPWALFVGLVCLVVMRELIMAGTREALAGRFVLPVTRLSRAKTALIYLAIPLLMWDGGAATLGLGVLALSLLPAYAALAQALGRAARA